MSLEKYTTLHKYAQRIAEDDLTQEQDEAATVAFAVGRVTQAIGSTIQEAAVRLHLSDNKEAVNNFHAGVSMVAEHLNTLTTEVAEMVAPFADILDEPVMQGGMKLSEAVPMFNDGTHTTLLSEAQQFIGEHLKKATEQ